MCHILHISTLNIVRQSNVNRFFILHFIPVEGNAESSLAFGTRDVGVDDETLNSLYTLLHQVHVEMQNIMKQ